MVKNLSANAEDTRGFNPWVGKIPWKRKWQPIPVFLAWRIPLTEEPGGLQSAGPQGVRHDRTTELNSGHLEKHLYVPSLLIALPIRCITVLLNLDVTLESSSTSVSRQSVPVAESWQGEWNSLPSLLFPWSVYFLRSIGKL